MVTLTTLPSLVGYTPDEAEQMAAAHGCTIRWLDTPPPRWLSASHVPRVGRQRLGEDGVLELLRVLVPEVGSKEVSGKK